MEEIRRNLLVVENKTEGLLEEILGVWLFSEVVHGHLFLGVLAQEALGGYLQIEIKGSKNQE